MVGDSELGSQKKRETGMKMSASQRGVCLYGYAGENLK